MIFIETKLFTKLVPEYFSDEEYANLQEFLVNNPDSGDVIKNAGGLRKLRWKLEGKGKRGGIRVIYYWYVSKDQIYLMTLYAKNEIKDLTEKEKKLLKQMIEELTS